MLRVIAPVLLLAHFAFSQTTGSVEGVVVDRVTEPEFRRRRLCLPSQPGLVYEATTDVSETSESSE
jgi:hypothetical protein